MSEAVGCLVIAEHELPTRFTASFGRWNVDGLSLRRVGSPALALREAITGEVDSVVVLDPRIEFLRPFTRADLHDAKGRPLAFASEERERLVDGSDPGADVRTAIRGAVGGDDRRDLRARGLRLWSGSVIRSWQATWLEPRGWTFEDALAAHPDADAWYLAWLLREHGPSAAIREPIVAVMDTPQRVLDYRLRGMTRADLARGYVGMLTDGPASWLDGEAPGAALGERLPAAGLARAGLLRATRTAPRVQRWLGLSP